MKLNKINLTKEILTIITSKNSLEYKKRSFIKYFFMKNGAFFGLLDSK
jgi:hypothetical protein